MGEVPTTGFFDRKEWHGIGQVFTPEQIATMSVSDLAAIAFPGPFEGSSWNVQTAPLKVDAHGTTYDVEGKCAVVRDIEPHVLGIHSDSYPAVSPVERMRTLDDALDGGGSWTNAFDLRQGKQIVMTKALGDEVLIGGVDAIKLYAVSFDSYDGSLCYTCGTTFMRPRCENTLNPAIAEIEARPHIKLKHTKNMVVTVGQVREAMAVSFKWADEFVTHANKLIDTPVSKGHFESIIRQAFPKAKSDYAPFSREQYSMIGVLESSPTIQDDIRYTGWGAFNAVSEWLEHGKGRRDTSGSDDATVSERTLAERRLEGALLTDQKELAKVASLILANA